MIAQLRCDFYESRHDYRMIEDNYSLGVTPSPLDMQRLQGI